MNKKGFTLVEMLVAIALLSLVLSLVSGGIVTAMKANRVQDAASTSQTRARRVLEIVSQDLRSAALGGVTNTPYASDNRSISFAKLAGGAGYEGQIARTTLTTITSATAPTWTGNSMLLVYGNDDPNFNAFADGDAFVSAITSVNPDPNDPRRWDIRHGSCWGAIVDFFNGRNTLNAQNQNPTQARQSSHLVFNVDSMGYRFDANLNQLLRQRAGEAQQVVAFDIEDFTVSYIYRDKTSGALDTTRTQIRTSSGAPLIEDADWKLAQIQIDLDVAEPSTGRDADGNLRTITRTYTSYVDLSDSSSSFQVGRIGTC